MSSELQLTSELGVSDQLHVQRRGIRSRRHGVSVMCGWDLQGGAGVGAVPELRSGKVCANIRGVGVSELQREYVF